MDVINLGIGFIFTLFTTLYFWVEINKKLNKREHYDPLMFAAQLQIYAGLFIIFILGIVMLYRELRNIF
jgi:energy-coupling factor transporter transmembrane protein EcfT